jgi:hypothetical protein
MSMADTSFALGTLEHDLALLAAMGGSGEKHLSAPQVLAPRGDPLRETRLNLSTFLAFSIDYIRRQ